MGKVLTNSNGSQSILEMDVYGRRKVKNYSDKYSILETKVFGLRNERVLAKIKRMVRKRKE
ncbi:hypothetical protein lbkm_1557 [Lachnospiraceae bacterium KM106-2]|nr:hypothetical protein lbkm_1557 [Lachnospiraceae bacterium KM106-2]